MRGLGPDRGALRDRAAGHRRDHERSAPAHLELLGTRRARRPGEGGAARRAAGRRHRGDPRDAPELEPLVPDGPRRAPLPRAARSKCATVARAPVDGRAVAFSFTARHQAANAAAALTVVEALGLPLPDEPVEVEFSRWRCEESQLPGGGLLINDACNANPVVDARRARASRRARGRRRTVAVLGEMAELGAEAPRYHDEVGACARRSASTSCSASASSRDATGRRVGSPTPQRERARAPVVVPATRVLVKGSRAVGLEVVADALAGVARRDPRPHRRRRRADRLGPRRAEVHRLPSRERVRPAHPRGGPRAPLSQAGDADDGRAADPVRGDDRVPADVALPAAVAHRALRDARVRRDRLPRRLHQAHAQRSLGL